MYNRTEYSYPKNVEMVFLAYSMFGNIILKDYFSKQGDKFYFHLAKGAENHLFQIMMKIGENLDINLENYHSIIYSQKGNSTRIKNSRSKFERWNKWIT